MKAKVNKQYKLNIPETSKEEVEKRNKRDKYLASLGVYTYLYTSDDSLNIECIFRKNRALAPHERSAVPLGTDHCPVG